MMKSGERTTGASARAHAWAAIDRQLVANAIAIPWSFDKQANIEGTAVRGINSGGTQAAGTTATPR